MHSKTRSNITKAPLNFPPNIEAALLNFDFGKPRTKFIIIIAIQSYSTEDKYSHVVQQLNNNARKYKVYNYTYCSGISMVQEVHMSI